MYLNVTAQQINMKLGLILGDQLFPEPVEAEHYLMIESQDLATHYKYHKHKIILFFAAMRSYADSLKEQGKVTYGELANKKYTEVLEGFLKKNKVTEIITYEIEDEFFEKEIKEFCKKNTITLTIKTSPGFLTTRKEFSSWREQNKLFMATFYEWQRKRLKILIKDGKPEGGKWSFDEENRKKLPKNHTTPKLTLPKPTRHVEEVNKLVEKKFFEHPGTSENFCYPTTREQALDWLQEFLEKRFEHFGDYEDAIEEQEQFMYHSVLSPLLNLGLLTPKEVVDKALQCDVPLNCKEGFVRQIIGWREFVRGCYHTSNYEGLNHFNHENTLTKSWYDGTTGIVPLDDTIKKTLKFGYAHHIERLMIVGNIMLLSEIHPDEVNKWFMELFVDSADWVMAPNVYSMSQFADGGQQGGGFATKPYVCGSNYIRKMSHYKEGEWCDVMDGLYWRFIRKNQKTFSKNPRMAMMAKMALSEKHDEKITKAEEWLKENTL